MLDEITLRLFINIFVTDESPQISARNLCDKHMKMLLESCQMLCSAFPSGSAPYKKTHYNHPCTIWSRTTKQNFEWLIDHASEISSEYTFRYGKIHKSSLVLQWCKTNYKILGLKNSTLTEFPLAMPAIYQVKNDIVQSYRNFYIGDKSSFAVWNRGRVAPEWYITHTKGIK